ncbi:MAG: hypothetical protein F4Y63_11195 [Chloroflexi bacterium]|nr:hypothetical protein [Chloroflexota bacterium]MYF79590.1 hypothetical protein [Chloroflexota bacterium]MYK61408.1 hypothetical protein [Chloroflexota bacterium]
MDGIKRIIGALLILFSIVIAVQFIAWRLYDSGDVWTVVNYISLVAIALAFYFNLERKRKNETSGDDSVNREYIESNVLYFGTMVLAALFLFNWLNLLVNGAKDVGEEVMHDVVWVVVDVMLIVLMGATGGHLLKGARSD